MERFLRQKLDDFSPLEDTTEPIKIKRQHEDVKEDEPVEKLPRLATEADISEKRKEIKEKSKSSSSTAELEVVDVQTTKSSEQIEIVRVSPAKIEPPKEEFVPQVTQPRKSCHGDMHIKRPPMRVSVIQPTGRSITSGQSSDYLYQRPPSMISSTTPSEKLILQQYKNIMPQSQTAPGPSRGHPYSQSGNETVTVKVENTQADETPRVYVRQPQYPPSLQSGSSGGVPQQFRVANNSQGASWSSQFSSMGSQPPNELLIKQPYSGSCHNRTQVNRLQVPHFPVAPHEQNGKNQILFTKLNKIKLFLRINNKNPSTIECFNRAIHSIFALVSRD